MISLDVQFDDPGTRETLAALMARMADAEAMHEGMAHAVAIRVRDHLDAVKVPRSPNTGWWGNVRESVESEARAGHAAVRVTHPGAALRFYGGTVSQKPGGPLLAIPSKDVPVVDNTRPAPRDSALGPLAFLPARRPARKGVVGVLVEAAERTRTRDTKKGRKGTTYTQPLHRPAGRLMYTLMTETTHPEDPTVLPTMEEMTAAAALAGRAYLDLWEG